LDRAELFRLESPLLADELVWREAGAFSRRLMVDCEASQPHIAVRQLRDWFAQFPYLSKLRDPQVLARAISEALAREQTRGTPSPIASTSRRASTSA